MTTLKAIVLKNNPYSDTQRILHVFSAEEGYISLITPRTSFTRKNNNSFQCMQIVDIEYLPNKQNNLHKLKNISLKNNTIAIYFNIYKMNIALLWGEILDLLLRDETQNPTLFEFLENAIEYLNTSQNDTANFNLFFLFKLCKLIGFSINTATFQPGYVFNINDGRFYPKEETNNYISGPHAANMIQKICTCQLHELASIHLDKHSRSILLDILLTFLGFHLNINFNTKSLKVIREVFG